MYKCVDCNIEVKEDILAEYEFEEGVPLKNVRCLMCPKCKRITFTEEQAVELEKKTEILKK